MQTSRTLGIAFDRRSVGKRHRPLAESLRHLVLACAVAAIAVIATVGEPLAEASYPKPLKEWERDWTVLTMAPDGAWGVGTDMGVIEAISRAIGNCRTMTSAEIGCGGQFIMFRDAWSLGVRCGDRNILIAEENLDDAEQSASWRAYELKKLYVPDLPPCSVVVTVDPAGKIVPPDMSNAGRIYSWP